MPETEKPKLVKPPYRWYELNWIVPYRDVVLVIGYCVFETGIFLIPRWGLQLGLMTTGAGLGLAAWYLFVKG
jgi:hypothetical protein